MIYADFQNTDVEGQLRLICKGTLHDLQSQEITLSPGMQLRFYTDDMNSAGQGDPLVVDGVVKFSKTEQCWVAEIDWKQIKHLSEMAAPVVAPTQQIAYSNLASRQ